MPGGGDDLMMTVKMSEITQKERQREQHPAAAASMMHSACQGYI
jgi:hypothetical protein